MRGYAVLAAAILNLAPACGNDEIPQSVIEATKPPEVTRSKPVPPPLSPSNENFEGIPIPMGAKHQAMLDGRFRYLIEVTPGDMIGYFKKYALPASVELDGAATVLRNAVAKESKGKKKMDIVIRPSTPGWTQIEITPEPEFVDSPAPESETLNAANKSFMQAD